MPRPQAKKSEYVGTLSDEETLGYWFLLLVTPYLARAINGEERFIRSVLLDTLQAPAIARFDNWASYFNLSISLILFTVNRSWGMPTSLFLKKIAYPLFGINQRFPLSPFLSYKCAPYPGITVRHGADFAPP
jgi:hypothetical protein